MPDFLHLPNMRTVDAQDLGDHYRVEAVGCVVPTSCPACFNALYRHGTQRQTYMDTPMPGGLSTLDSGYPNKKPFTGKGREVKTYLDRV